MREIAHKKDIPTELIVEIEKLSNLGFGIARIDGYVIFVENACPEDKVKIRLTKKNKNYANAVITEIIKPSPHRINPICPMQKVCGACQLQFIDYEFQLKQKQEILNDIFHGFDIEIRNVIPSPKILKFLKRRSGRIRRRVGEKQFVHFVLQPVPIPVCTKAAAKTEFCRI